MTRQRRHACRVLPAALLFVSLCPPGWSAEPRQATPEAANAVARVGDTEITRAELEEALHRRIRRTFYHGKPRAGQAQDLRREVFQELIERKLLLREAERRGLQPDADLVRQRVEAVERRYRDRIADWDKHKQRLLEPVRRQLEADDRLRQLELQVREVDPPSDQQTRSFYDANREKFTEPERRSVSMILLQVDASAPVAAWNAAMEQSKLIDKRIDAGADFAEMARKYSDDASAENGGDMGYLHRGMLNEAAEQVIDGLRVGEVTDPMRVLRGIAMFRLNARVPPTLRPYEDARDRARQLWIREQGEGQWQALREKLRASTPVEVLDPALAG